MKPAILALTVVLLPTAVVSLPSGGEQKGAIAINEGAAATIERVPSREVLRGVIAAVDESNDRITVRLTSGAIADFKVQDGLIFNAIRYGDQIEIMVEKIGGANTIVGLTEE
jgi:hypothetical protein